MVDICSNGIDQHFEVIDSVNSSNLGSNISLSDLTNLPEDISSIKSAVKQITKESSPQFLKLYNNKELTCEQFESMCSQKVTEIMASELFWGNNVFSELKLLKENEKLWHEKCCSLNEEFKELKHFLNIHKQEGCSMKLPKQAISLPRPDSVSIAVEDDDDDVVELEFETVESASSSTSKITNTTKKKNGDSEKTITYLELSKNPSSSSSSFITGTASRSPRRTSVLNKYTINTSPNSQKLKPILTEVSPPVPGIPNQRSLSTWKGLPPAPHLTILKSPEVQNMPQALVLSWTMNVNGTIAEVISYQIYAYQETPDQPPNIDLWKKIGDVNALPLPMACSLTYLSNGQKYHFIVRAVDVYTRVGPFSTPESMYLKLI
ncbi:activating transcription factor 7-interacting protein 1 [Acyrthosiphon pisum]|uniref:Activating transcription factor 7-interacting protein Fn3 domain-containing protein n=1 Tax=Acyrthosiphon pisum TaxID=7029 RepID=A0A8R2AB58_ACYPI|nr:activating transcription factor 7-interacting protein 1 [Acyrthosiphon pisum]|eukprot:XP_003242338.1 PREDICTED: activating transcription factor 7-interacting protein 1 [Acyrthosiphon pisum]